MAFVATAGIYGTSKYDYHNLFHAENPVFRMECWGSLGTRLVLCISCTHHTTTKHHLDKHHLFTKKLEDPSHFLQKLESLRIEVVSSNM